MAADLPVATARERPHDRGTALSLTDHQKVPPWEGRCLHGRAAPVSTFTPGRLRPAETTGMDFSSGAGAR
ncbi:hypothetical protein Ppa06_53240 [Planomonospora parontospora subsp. parontospora]|uniref:Uncharacterized protein n=2 Tax=Planomonospora parontospora TaxID=58119 RepID=A0AA37F6W7_9ACTN|nr:hypothetical protein GCM10010126_54490 [Planomonospora parontospora]GII11526.1 hypothetical protein Ppa06_53240 [Planomonospora parontospora subsp. parontospora]